MVTVREIFDAAIDLMDEQNERTGATITADTREYELRTISILNTAIAAIYPYSSQYAEQSGRPSPRVLFSDDRSKPDFDQYIDLDDILCRALLPLYLAAMLRAGEDMEFSMRMMSEYNNALVAVRNKERAEFEPISTPYGLF